MKRLYTALILLSLIWGSSFFFIKVLLRHYEPASIAFLRCFFGVVTITFIMVIFRIPFHLHKIPWFPMIIVGLLQTAVPWYLIGHSETRLTSSMAAVLNATTPFWTIISGFLFFNMRAHRNQWLGLVFCIVGIFILMDFHPEHLISVDVWGVIMMLVATFSYGYSAQVSKQDLQGLTIYQTVFWTLLVGCISSGIVAISFESFSIKPLFEQPEAILSVLMLGSMCSAIAYLLFFYMVQKGSAEFSTMVSYLVPATAIIWGVVLLNETIKWTLLAGLVLIFVGLFLSNRIPIKGVEK